MKSIVILLISFFISLSQTVIAQVKVQGNVKDSQTLEPVAGARLQIVHGKDSIIHQGISDAKGNFLFLVKQIKPGAYTIVSRSLGYDDQSSSLNIFPGSKEIETLNILMKTGTINLDLIDISAKPLVLIKGDTTEFDASHFPTEPYADSDALIKQLPGTIIDDQGNVIMQGEEVVKILVDNKEFFTTDPRLALKNLPADIIDKVQIIDERSEQAQFTGFDDGQRRKVINIVTKKDKRNGYFGKLNTGVGTVDRFAGNANVSLFDPKQRITITGVSNNVNLQNFSMAEVMMIGMSGGFGGGRSRGGGGFIFGGRNNSQNGQPRNTITSTLGVNFNRTLFKETLDFNADYGFNKTNSLVHSFTNRETLIGNNSNQIRREENESDRLNQSHRLNLNLRWNLDSMQEITFRPSFRIQNMNNSTLANSFTFLTNQDPQNQTNRTQSSENQNLGLNGDFNYRLKLRKAGRTISASLNSSLNTSNGLAQTYSLNEYFTNSVISRTDTTNLRNDTESIGNGFNSRLAYTEPISKKHRMQVNYSFRNNSNFSNRETLNWLAETGQFSELNTQLSNKFTHDYIHHSAGLSYQINQDAFNFDAGLDFQKSLNKNNRTFPDVSLIKKDFVSYLPNATISYRPNRALNIQFQYTTNTQAPSLQQLQDVINNQNALNIQSGNPELKQEFQHRFSWNLSQFSMNQGQNFNINLNGEFSNNKIVNSTFIASNDTLIAPGILLGKGGQFTKPLNRNGYYSFRSYASWGAPVKALKINLSLSTGLFLTHDIGYINLQETSSDSYGINQSVGINSRISEKLIFGVNYSINYNNSNNSLISNTTYRYLTQNLSTDFNYIFWKGVRVNTSIKYNSNQGMSQGYNQSFIVWNATLAKKMFKRQQAEISLDVVDILNKNSDMTRNVTETYITDISSNTLQQFFMLSFTYNLRKFGLGGRGPTPGTRGQRGSFRPN